MKIIFCNGCGVVLNQDALNFPDIYYHDTQELIPGNSVWDDELGRYMPVVNCPVCEAVIVKRRKAV